jgi:predicted transcriptional regulator
LADGPDSDIVYITSRDHDLRGHLAPARLLRLDDDAPIAEHLEEEPYYIAAGTRLSALIDHAGWQTRHVLPVVDPHQQVIGALYHNALYRGLKARSGEEQATPVTPIQDVGRLYAGTLLALFETASGLIRGEDRTGE